VGFFVLTGLQDDVGFAVGFAVGFIVSVATGVAGDCVGGTTVGGMVATTGGVVSSIPVSQLPMIVFVLCCSRSTQATALTGTNTSVPVSSIAAVLDNAFLIDITTSFKNVLIKSTLWDTRLL